MGVGGGREAPDLDRHAQAVAGDGGGEVFDGAGVEVAAVTQQGGVEDFAVRDRDGRDGNGGHGALRLTRG